MATYPDPRYRRRRWVRWCLLYAGAVVAVTVAVMVFQAAVDSGAVPQQALPPSSLPTLWGTAPAASSSPHSPGGDQALTGPVRVVQGAELVNGVYLGFPHTTAGAVSAADEFTAQIGSTLDPGRAAAVMRMAADPAYTRAPQQAASGTAADRAHLGLPSSGPLPGGTALQTIPMEYQARDVTPDKVTVLLLCDVISTIPGQGTQTSIAVVPVRMHWADGDWKVLPYSTDKYSGLAAEPGSPQAAALGWQELRPAGG